MSGSFDEERKEILRDFISESRDRLDDCEPKIIKLEKIALESGKTDLEIVNDVFRLFHTLKSNSAFFELHTISAVTHEAETLLDIFRKEKAKIEPGHIDIMCRTTDFIRKTLSSLETTASDSQFEKEAVNVMKDIRDAIEAAGGEEQVGRVKKTAGAGKLKREALKEPDPAKEDKKQQAIASDPAINGEFCKSALEAVSGINNFLLNSATMADYEDRLETARRDFHTIKGNAGFLGFGDIERAAKCGQEAMEYLEEAGERPGNKLRGMLAKLTGALNVTLKSMEDGSKRPMPNVAKLLEMIGAVCEKGQEEDRAEAPEGSQGKMGQMLKQASQAPRGAQEIQTTIRVDVEKLDMLLDLVGEMVIAEAMVINNDSVRGLHSEKIDKALSHLDKITRDIQEVSMSMRMIPLASTFNKMPRVVRDISHKLGKKISLEITGEETEVDKTIIELIHDPLMHIVRNSVDHGIEPPDARKAAGKPEEGRIKIEAKHSTGEVWIIVKDDGRGLDRGRILKKAIEKNLLRPSEADSLKDEEVWKLIFLPGFSTAEQVSDISGRGVGLDVVLKNIEKMRGRIDVRTSREEGTSFVVRIPLTLAIIEGMVMRVGVNRYTIPISSIKNSIKPKSEQISTLPGGQEVVSLRGVPVPIVRLHEFFRINSTHTVLADGLLILIENEDRRCCLFVDELIGQQQIVIKGLSQYLGRVKGISGCAILGDGDISMIIDAAELIKIAESNKTELAGRR